LTLFRSRLLLLNAAMVALTGALSGCQDRLLTIDRDAQINTFNAPDGKPLRVDIVCVRPEDLSGSKREVNRELVPGSTINSADWFAKKPTLKSASQKDDTQHYQLPASQILSYTDEPQSEIYGKKVGGKILGGAHDPNRIGELSVPKPGDIFDPDSVIYVFGRFTDDRDNVLPIPPAVFHRTGAFRKQIAVHIRAQEIVRTSQREQYTDDAKVSDRATSTR
jgi:hypothetical protein